jgi:crotonobetainyl-CoA:carnitine CoA-transferase CaiB-like acyl-CoA transferase
MSDGVLYLLAMSISAYYATGGVPLPGQNVLNGHVPAYNVYQCKDGGWISLGSLEPHFWANLCRVMGCEDYIPHQYDGAKRDEIFAHLREQFMSKTRDEWFEVLKQTDICAAPVYSLDQALQDPHNLARNMVIDVEHEKAGKVKQVGIGTKLSETPGRCVRLARPSASTRTRCSLSWATARQPSPRCANAAPSPKTPQPPPPGRARPPGAPRCRRREARGRSRTAPARR